MKFRGLFYVTKKAVVSVLMIAMVLEVSGMTLGVVFERLVNIVEAAQVVIEASPNITGSGHTKAGSGVVSIVRLQMVVLRGEHEFELIVRLTVWPCQFGMTSGLLVILVP